MNENVRTNEPPHSIVFREINRKRVIRNPTNRPMSLVTCETLTTHDISSCRMENSRIYISAFQFFIFLSFSFGIWYNGTKKTSYERATSESASTKTKTTNRTNKRNGGGNSYS